MKGYFVDSLPFLRNELLESGEKLAILRMDGDMYDSTVDILYNLYDLVAVNGFIVVDDWGWDHSTSEGSARLAKSLWGARDAVMDFRAIHGIEVEDSQIMYDIDGSGAYWMKTKEVEVQRWRYERSLDQNDKSGKDILRPSPALTMGNYYDLMVKWNE